MKILMVNKFLYPNGGSETYIFDVGNQLLEMGHKIEYFGMNHKDRIVGNRMESYTESMDFHQGGLQKLFYPFKIIYSVEARKKIRKVLEDFQPDVVHFNNINFQLTPSIIYEVKKWERKRKHPVKLIYTAHDYQWVCPNHLMMIPASRTVCFACKGSNYKACVKNRCIHNSLVKSLFASLEGYLYHRLKTYQLIDHIICPSYFMEKMLSTDPILKPKLITCHNYCNLSSRYSYEKKDYILYFGRYAKEKGVEILLETCKELPQVSFVFAGGGPLEEEVEKLSNVVNMGFLKGEELRKVIGEARVSILPSICNENCPFTVIESQVLGTPVISFAMGGIPELITEEKTGMVVEAGNKLKLKQAIQFFWEQKEEAEVYSKNCKEKKFDSLEEYCEKILKIYQD